MSNVDKLRELAEFRFGRHHAVEALVQDAVKAGILREDDPWISVSERLPETDGIYAVVRIGRKIPGRAKFVVGRGFGGMYPKEITHWTRYHTLPAAPKGGE